MSRVQKTGFTLIEMLVVIGIIGILATMIIMGAGQSRAKARDTQRLSDIRQIQSYLEINYNPNSGYPPNLNSWTNVPKDPLSPAQNYQYVTCQINNDGSNQHYTLKANLETNRVSAASPITCSSVSGCNNQKVLCVSDASY